MNTHLAERIVALLLVHTQLTASEIAHELSADVAEVRDELRRLVAARRVARTHAGPGVLRYRVQTHEPRATRTPAAPSAAPRSAAATRHPKLCKLLDGINAIAREADVAERLQQLEILGAQIGTHLRDAMLEAQLQENA